MDYEPLDSNSMDVENTEAEDESDNDQIVREFDVFVSQALSQQLYIFQYPHRPVNRPLEVPTTARVRPKHRMVELEYNLDAKGANYNKDSIKMERQILTSQRMPVATNYCVGAVRENQLHLTPLNALCQMHPDFRHIDEAVEEVKMIDDDDEEKAQKEKPKKMELQQVSYKKKETDDEKTRRRTTYAHLRDQLRRDPFVELTVHDADSDHAFNEFDKLFCETPAPSRRFSQQGASYLAALNYRGQEPDDTSGFGKPADLKKSEPETSSMPLSEKVLHMLRKAGVVSFQAMLDCDAGVQGEDELISALMRHGVLVRGNWVLRSGQREHITDAQIMARDCILIMMEKFGAVSRPQLQESLTAFTQPQLIEILSEFATLNKKSRRWEMKIPDCYEFIEEFGAVTAEQQRQWNKREREVTPLLQMIGEPQCAVIGPVQKPVVERVMPVAPPRTSYDSEEEFNKKRHMDVQQDQKKTIKPPPDEEDMLPPMKMEIDEEMEPETKPPPVKVEEAQEIPPSPPKENMKVKEEIQPEKQEEPVKKAPKVEKTPQLPVKRAGVLQPGISAKGILNPGQKGSFKPKLKPKIKPKKR